MAIHPATEYGASFDQTNFGEKLEVNDGNGDTFGDQTVEIDDTLLASQLADIAYMRSLIAENPSIPGDDKVLEILEFEAMMLRSGMNDKHVSRILETYPDMPEKLSEAADRMPEEIGGSVGDPMLAREAFREAPIDFIKSLDPREVHELFMGIVTPEFETSDGDATEIDVDIDFDTQKAGVLVG